jgi:hypothetical protein
MGDGEMENKAQSSVLTAPMGMGRKKNRGKDKY